MTANKISRRLRAFADEEKARVLRRFFKTGPGEYGEGDRFLGVVVPDIRIVAREFQEAPLPEALALLKSEYHEERLLALLILVRRFERGDQSVQKTIYGLYRKNTARINSWDLVDLSAPNIVGAYLLERSRKPLYALAASSDLWRRRIAILATLALIRKGEFDDTLRISRLLLSDEEDLIHKAVGWMLREVGKRDVVVLERFLSRHCRVMPRTMLRYAIERFPEKKRKRYLNGTV